MRRTTWVVEAGIGDEFAVAPGGVEPALAVVEAVYIGGVGEAGEVLS